MDRIIVKHQGFEIIYGENSDMWECFTLKMSAGKLSVIKSKINQYAKKRLMTANIILGYKDYGNLIRVQVVSRDTSSGKFWCIRLDTNSRFLADPKNFVHWDAELEEKLRRIEKLKDEARSLSSEASNLEKSITCMAEDDAIALLSGKVTMDE